MCIWAIQVTYQVNVLADEIRYKNLEFSTTSYDRQAAWSRAVELAHENSHGQAVLRIAFIL